jgi:hypothetical protein
MQQHGFFEAAGLDGGCGSRDEGKTPSPRDLSPPLPPRRPAQTGQFQS